MPEATLDAFIGTYEQRPGLAIKVWKVGRTLKCQIDGQSAFDLIPESATRFFLKEGEVTFDFELNREMKAEGLVINQGGMTLPFKRVG